MIAAQVASWTSFGCGAEERGDGRRNLPHERREVLGGIPLHRHGDLLDFDVGEAAALEQPGQRLRGGPRERPGVPGGGGGSSSRFIAVPDRNAQHRHPVGRPPRADRHPSALLEEPANSRGGPLAVGLEDDPEARECSVEAVLGEVKGRGVGLDELDVLQARLGGALTTVGEHLGGDVGGHHAAIRSRLPRRGQRRLTVARSDVEDPAPGLDGRELDQALADRSGGRVDQLRPLAPTRGRDVPLLALGAPELSRVDAL